MGIFITGYPSPETEQKNVLRRRIGEEKLNFSFDNSTNTNAVFYKEELRKFNSLRIHFNYKHFLDDQDDLFKINPEGFERLDVIINTTSKHGDDTILDQHAVTGGQNQDWHSDSGI
jgi:aryl-phospho-beta-D-glucosidase BglC (GH1 family)